MTDPANVTGDVAVYPHMPLDLKDYLVLIADALPTDFMGDLITDAEAHGDWQTASLGAKQQVESTIRNCQQIGITADGQAWLRGYANGLYRLLNQCSDLYSERFPALSSKLIEQPQLLRYQEGGHYIEHVDNSNGSPRALSIVIALNQDYEGGELSFFQDRVRLSLQAGEVLMFPSAFMFTHAVRPVSKGIRYSLVAWLR